MDWSVGEMMVHLYAIDIRDLPDPREKPALLHDISSSRRRKAMEYLQGDDRKRCLGAGILLAKILPLYGESPERITFGTRGKPEAEGVHFNLSHSGTLAICAVGGKAVGCDIEKTGKEAEGVARRFFHQNEVEYLQRFQGAERDEMFFRLWTLKESYIKMTGEGMYLPLQDFEILFSGERVQVRRSGKILPCHVMEYSIPGYKVSVCAEEEDFAGCVEMI